MDFFYSLIGVSSVIVLLIGAWRFLNWAWITPKKMEKSLRRQGLQGNSYRFLFGDTRDIGRMLEEVKSKPISITDDIFPRIVPFINETMQHKGKNSFFWLGPRPAMVILDSEQVKEVFTKNFTYQKPRANPISKLRALGLASLDTEKWAKHRRLLNPAFHVEKLKNIKAGRLTLLILLHIQYMVPAFYLSCNEMLSKWENLAPAEGSFELDVWPYLQTFTSDVISRTAFGSNYEKGRRIFELQREQALYFEQVMQSIYLPGWSFVPTKRIKRMQKEVNSLVMQKVGRVARSLAGRARRADREGSHTGAAAQGTGRQGQVARAAGTNGAGLRPEKKTRAAGWSASRRSADGWKEESEIETKTRTREISTEELGGLDKAKQRRRRSGKSRVWVKNFL
ncbi:cytochrome P450 CYP72A219-like [Coffea eugenioides]|uniref:cytochrome P450 CYP72A219-like n=1 Tax=Coffea eugenioides TaxID=49369 RepID=UPI000F604E9B|nr:cytochrome P450 CYP72A219-like [Coffea eugenioides]